MIIILRANFDYFRKKLVAVLRSFCSIHMYHKFLYNLHEILLGHLQNPVAQLVKLKTTDFKCSKPFRREDLEHVTVSIRLYHQGKVGLNPCAPEQILGAFLRSLTWLVDQGISNFDQSLRSKYAISEHTAR